MRDIVERLNECAMNHARGSWSWPEEKADAATGGLLSEAADEIERLRALVPEQEGASEALGEPKASEHNAREAALETCAHKWSEWVPVLGGRGFHVERKCAKCGTEQYDD